MGCLLALLAMVSPRLAIFFVWLFTNRMSVAFGSFWIALLGFLLMPWTTLAWAAAYAPARGIRGIGWVVVGVAVAFDLSTHLNATRARRVRSAEAA